MNDEKRGSTLASPRHTNCTSLVFIIAFAFEAANFTIFAFNVFSKRQLSRASLRGTGYDTMNNKSHEFIDFFTLHQQLTFLSFFLPLAALQQPRIFFSSLDFLLSLLISGNFHPLPLHFFFFYFAPRKWKHSTINFFPQSIFLFSSISLRYSCAFNEISFESHSGLLCIAFDWCFAVFFLHFLYFLKIFPARP